MDNYALLLLAGAKKIKQTIGEAGQQGFGVGVYGGDPADLTAMGLSPMQGCKDPASENYGNYTHTNGSVMVFIPAFCYRIGSASAPSYERDAENALEIRDAELGEGDGWILHRAFIDGGVQKLGFFIDKYICSKDETGKLAVSVKNRDNIILYNDYLPNSSSMPDCTGELYDAITLSRARGEGFSLITGFQWAALSMLSLAHGQAATSSRFCGWYDASHVKNYPKGNNSDLKDYDDRSVTWTAHIGFDNLGKTGSGTPFVKTTHNGQMCGVTDVNGSQQQVALGFTNPKAGNYSVFKDSVKAHDITRDNVMEISWYDSFSVSTEDYNAYYWGANAFYSDASGINRALCGLMPKVPQYSEHDLFGCDSFNPDCRSNSVLYVGGDHADQYLAGLFYRRFFRWNYGYVHCGFRAAGYAS